MRQPTRPSAFLRAALLGVVVTTALIGLPPAASAQHKLEQAREHFDRGTAFFKQGNYEEALKELMQAFVLDPNPLLVYNIARVHEERGDLHNALKFFQNYLTIDPRAKNAGVVKRKIRQLKAAIKRLPQQGFLTVRTEPPGAAVRVNGRLVGQAPLNEERLAAGRYKLEILLDRYETYHADVVLLAGRATTLEIRLVDLPSSVLISTTPPSAMATLLEPRQQPLGQCPCVVNLSGGRYKVRVEMQGMRTREFDFVKQAHEQLKVPVTLVPIVVMGRLMVTANVPGAQVRVDGQPIGVTPLQQPLDIRAGQIVVEVSANGYRTFNQTVLFDGNGMTNVSVVLEPMQAAIVPGLPPVGQPQVVYRTTSTTSAQRGWGWTLTSLGIAALVGGGVSTTVALLKQRQFDDATYFREPKSGQLIRQDLAMSDAIALENEALTFQNVSIGLYAGGGAMLLTGIILVATDSGSEMESMASRLRVSPLPGGAFVSVDLPLD